MRGVPVPNVCMNRVAESLLLSPGEGPAARVWNARGSASAVLVCEHASRFIPAALDNLGLDDAAQRSHAAWDIGAFDLAQDLSAALDAPLVASCVSRLVYDCNRPPTAPDSIPSTSERIGVPGNADLTPQARQAREAEVYTPFRDLLHKTLDQQASPPVLITIHSFTPVYFGQDRSVEIGLLHDADDGLARALLTRLRRDTDLNVQLNEPYSARDGVTHTLHAHAIARNLPNVMIEVRNDLLDHPAGLARITALLAPALRDAVAAAHPSQSELSSVRQGRSS